MLLRIKFVVNKVEEEDHQVDPGLVMMIECRKIRLYFQRSLWKVECDVIA